MSDRNLLAIVDANPFPATDGKTYPIEGQLKGLAQWWNIDFLEVRRPGSKHGFDTKTHHDVARNVFSLTAPPSGGKVMKLATEVVGGTPYFNLPTPPKSMISNAVGNGKYDAIYVAPLALADWATAVADCLPSRPKLILNENDSITERFRRDYDLFRLNVLTWKNSAMHLMQSLRANYMAKIEKRIYSAFDLILVQTEKDRDVIIEDVGGSIQDKLLIAPNGIKESLLDLQYNQHNDKRLLHIGGLARNRRDLVFWFLKEVFLPLKKEMPDISIQLAGSVQEADRRTLQDMPGVEPLGFVSDVKDVLTQATMSIAPLFMRSGLVNKIADSMAAGVPSSGTAVFNGFPGFENGVHGFDVADAPAWRNVLSKTLSDPDLLSRVSTAGRELVTKNLRWSNTVNRLHERLCELVEQTDSSVNTPDESMVA